MTTGDTIGLAIVLFVITGVLWILHPILGTIALILTVSMLAITNKIVANMAKVAAVVAMVILIGTCIFAGDPPESDIQSTEITTPAEQPIVMETPVEQTTVPTISPVAEPVAVVITSKTMIDKVHRRGTNFEIEQASSAIWYAETFQDKYVCESGVTLSYYAPLDEYTTCTWVKANGEMTFFEPIGDDYLTYTENEWYDMFSGDDYTITSVKEGRKWLEALGTTW